MCPLSCAHSRVPTSVCPLLCAHFCLPTLGSHAPMEAAVANFVYPVLGAHSGVLTLVCQLCYEPLFVYREGNGACQNQLVCPLLRAHSCVPIVMSPTLCTHALMELDSRLVCPLCVPTLVCPPLCAHACVSNLSYRPTFVLMRHWILP